MQTYRAVRNFRMRWGISAGKTALLGLIAVLAVGAVLVVTGWSKNSPSAIAQVQPWVGDKAAGFVAGGVW